VRSTVPSGPVGIHVGIRDPGETSSMASKSGAWTVAEDIAAENKLTMLCEREFAKEGSKRNNGMDIYMRG
jgi:hypothetical protein